MLFSQPPSFPRRREPSDFKRRWIPACAGMTVVVDTLSERHFGIAAVLVNHADASPERRLAISGVCNA
jgi:hypothetical protein